MNILLFKGAISTANITGNCQYAKIWKQTPVACFAIYSGIHQRLLTPRLFKDAVSDLATRLMVSM
jgi:hypothetical protein